MCRYLIALTSIACLSFSSATFASPQATFFSRLRPLVEKRAAIILSERKDVITLQQKNISVEKLNAEEKERLNKLAKHYGLNTFKPSNTGFSQLLSRVDIIPTSMVLAQAADESAWGRSRFALFGHNLFGQWCFLPGCGMVPKRRPKGARYEVQRFNSESDAIASYFHNLNTGNSYSHFRELRAASRKHNKPLSGINLALGLKHYSSRGMKYVQEIQHIIRRYHLE